MSLCPTPLPPECEKELRRIVALVPDADLAQLAVTEQAFQTGGFRAGNVSAVRLRLAQLACGGPPLADGLRRALAKRSRSRTLTGVLTPEALAESRHALASLLGAPELLVALLLDERKEVRDKAEAWLQTQPPFLATEPEAALASLRELFAGLAELLGTSASSDAPPGREAWRQQKEALEQRLLDLQAEHRRLKGADDRHARVAALLKTREQELAHARERAETAEKALRQKTRELEETAAELTRETVRREERLAAALDLALAKEFHGWLAEARAVEAAATGTETSDDLLARAEAALHTQAAADRHSGNRATLAARLERLEAARAKVRAALRNALRQTPELTAVEASLSAEIRSLARLLEPEAPATPLEEALATRIHAAGDNELPRLRELPELFASLGVLGDDALERVRRAFQKRLAAAKAAVPPPPDPLREERQGASSLLGRALAGQLPAILLLDGHNVLFGLPARYSPARGESLPDAEKRKRLADDVARLAAPNPALRAWIVFDGPVRSDAQAAPNVRVTYSGGQGEHRADGVILDNLRFFTSTSPETPVLLVSNDGELCAAARRLGAKPLAVLDFGAYL